MRITGPPWFDVSFSNGFGDQSQAITQACWLGTELGLIAYIYMCSYATVMYTYYPVAL